MSALEKSSQEEEKPEVEDNAKTIRPGRSPAMLDNRPLASSPDIAPILEDYSDLATEEEEPLLLEKVADFKVNPCRSLFPLIPELAWLDEELFSARTLSP